MDVAVVLEEIEMPPRLLLEVMCRTRRTTHGAGVLGAPITTHRQVQLMRLLAGIQVLIHQFSRRLDTQPKQQNLVAVHHTSSCQLLTVNWHRTEGEFHSKH
jgi:hypothetical protein